MPSSLKKRTTVIVSIAAVVVIVAVAFAKLVPGFFAPDAAPVSQESPEKLVVQTTSNVENLNYLTASDPVAQEIQGYIYETLTISDPYTLQTIPWIADSLPAVSADKLSYEFSINKNARFSDGKPVTAEDFIFYLKALKDPDVDDEALRSFYSRVDRAEEVANDPHRLRVVMSQPYYLGDQWAGALVAFPKHIWDPQNLSDQISFDDLNHGGSKKNGAIHKLAVLLQDSARNMNAKFLVGSGPYQFRDWKRNDFVTIARTSTYWNAKSKYGKANSAEISWRTIYNAPQALALLQQGEVSFVPRIDKSQYAAIRAKLSGQGLTAAEYDYPTYSYIGYNLNTPMLADVRVRRAFAYALNSDTIITRVFHGMARSVHSPIFYRRPECDTSIAAYPYSLDSARALLKLAGWVDSNGDSILDRTVGGQKVKLGFRVLLLSGSESQQKVLQYYLGQLKKIGVDVQGIIVDYQQYHKLLRSGGYQAYLGEWSTEAVEGDLYEVWHSAPKGSESANYVGYNNPRVDQLIESIRGEFSYEKRKPLYMEVQRIIYEEQPYTFLVSEKMTGAYRSSYDNVSFFPQRPCYNVAWWVPTSQSKPAS